MARRLSGAAVPILLFWLLAATRLAAPRAVAPLVALAPVLAPVLVAAAAAAEDDEDGGFEDDLALEEGGALEAQEEGEDLDEREDGDDGEEDEDSDGEDPEDEASGAAPRDAGRYGRDAGGGCRAADGRCQASGAPRRASEAQEDGGDVDGEAVDEDGDAEDGDEDGDYADDDVEADDDGGEPDPRDWLAELDKDKDRKVSLAELILDERKQALILPEKIEQVCSRHFKANDKNGDGFISLKELPGLIKDLEMDSKYLVADGELGDEDAAEFEEDGEGTEAEDLEEGEPGEEDEEDNEGDPGGELSDLGGDGDFEAEGQEGDCSDGSCDAASPPARMAAPSARSR